MNIKLIIKTIISVIFSLSTLSGQNMILKSGSLFNFEGKEFSKGEIVTFLENQTESAKYIRKYKIEKSFSKVFLYTGLATTGATLLFAVTRETMHSVESPDWNYIGQILFGAVITGLTIAISLSWKSISSNSFKRARKDFNNSRSENIGSTIKPSLNLIVSNNGVGLALRF